MGEDARRKSDGEYVKIGTCESMYYLRFDQREDVAYPWPKLTDSTENLDPFMYRFPDPKEDGTLPGDFNGAWGGIKLDTKDFWSSFEPGSVDHGTMQVTDTHNNGYLFSLPCPEGNPDMYVGPYGKAPKVGRNGGITTLTLTAQRWYGGRLVLVVQCTGCQRSIRLPELKDAQAILDTLKKYADGYRQEAANDYLLGGPNTPPHIKEQLKANSLRSADYWDEVAARVVAGYNMGQGE